MIITVLFINSLILKTIESCKQTCHLALTGGSLNHTDVQKHRETTVPINFTGVITIEAAYIPDSFSKWEYIRFMQNQDIEPLVFQLYSQQEEKYAEPVRIFGEDELGVYPGSELEVYDLFDSISANITIQVSSVHVTTDNFYRVYLGDPGESHMINYSYVTKENWEELSFMRLNTTTQIKADNHLVYLKSVSACMDDVPAVCGPEVQIVVVSQSTDYNLSCSVYGAPYLVPVWSNGTVWFNDTEGSNGNFQPVLAVDGFLHTSTVFMENFNKDHSGVWKCYWKNINLGTFSPTKVFYLVEPVSIPSNETFYARKPKNQLFEWIVRTPSSKKHGIKLNCKEEGSSTDNSFIILYYFNSTQHEHRVTLTVTDTVESDKITCILYLVEKTGEHETKTLGELNTTTFLREGYNCKSGYYGVEDKCLKCGVNFTSPPRSINCSYISRDTAMPESAISRAWEVVFVAVAAVIVILEVVMAFYSYNFYTFNLIKRAGIRDCSLRA